MELNQYLSELESLVNIDSGPGCLAGLAEMAEFFRKRFAEMGWQTEWHDLAPETGVCLVCKNREAEHYDLMLIGHLDTVFPAGTAKERPFRIEGDKAYGPGVLDMKQGSLLMYHILKEIPKEVNDKLNIVAVFNPDEEIGSEYSKEVYQKYAEISDYAYIYEGASNDGARSNERKGRSYFTVNFRGKAGHCGYVFTSGARSAVSEMGRWIVALDSLQSEERNVTVNVGVAQGGIKNNVVADQASIEVDVRFPVPEELARLDAMLETLTDEARGRGIEVTITERHTRPALVLTEAGKEYVRHIEELLKSRGIAYKHRLRGGVSDANIIAQYGAICIDALGPAGDDDHSADEFLHIDSVLPSYELSMTLIKDLADRK
ncbi:MAG: M20 family metallopeptidase [Clostridia bacterium]|nr:M20 family metallopeptidase [Clostridia bacterium]